MENKSTEKGPAISNDLLILLPKHGILPEKIIFSAKLDRNRDGVYLENYILFTAEKVYLIGYITEIEKGLPGRVSDVLKHIYNTVFGSHFSEAVRQIKEISF